MKVNLNSRPEPVVPSGPQPPARPVEIQAVDQANFDRTAAVERALRDQPEARPEMVAHGKAVIGSPQYPPLAGIEGISRLLASNWPSSAE